MEIALYVLVAGLVAGGVYWVWRAARSEASLESYKAQGESQTEKIEALESEVLDQVQKDNQETHEAVQDALNRRDAKQLGFLLRKASGDDPN
jgi:uncharacterized membrane protein